MTRQIPTDWEEWQKNYDKENRKTWRSTLRMAIPMVLMLTAIVLWFGGWNAIAESLHLR